MREKTRVTIFRQGVAGEVLKSQTFPHEDREKVGAEKNN